MDDPCEGQNIDKGEDSLPIAVDRLKLEVSGSLALVAHNWS
jgi:hypothetical protein